MKTKKTKYFTCLRCNEQFSEYHINAHLRKCSKIRVITKRYSKCIDSLVKTRQLRFFGKGGNPIIWQAWASLVGLRM